MKEFLFTGGILGMSSILILGIVVVLITVIEVIRRLTNNDFTGIIHLTGKEKINRYDLGLKILKYLISDKQYLLHKESAKSSSYPRPVDVSMKSDILDSVLKFPQENSTTLIENIL